MTGLPFDPAVPQRDALLRHAGDPLHVKYRFGESLRVTWREGDEIFAARSGEHRGAETQLLGASVWRFPHDRRLAALPRLADPGALGCARTRLVAYAAERSATAACLNADGDVVGYAKAQAPGAAAAERRITRAVRAAIEPAVRIPRVLAGDGGFVLLEALPGRRLDGLGLDALGSLGAALATLHALPAPETRFARLDPPRLATAAGVLRRARPDVAAAATRLLARLDAARDDGRRAPVCLHGDANLRNALLLDDERIGLIDLEHVSAGPAAADLGQLLAGLFAARRPGGRALLAGYARVAPLPDRAALRWHTAASLLARVALPAVSRVRPDTLAQLPELLATGADLVAPKRRTRVAA
jgi:aminoglycoside phosphotransferase